jgi:integrating conjugative element protein (TIGR03749 family)
MTHQHVRGFPLALALTVISHIALAQVEIKTTARQIDAQAITSGANPTLDLGELPGETNAARAAPASPSVSPPPVSVPKANAIPSAATNNAKKTRRAGSAGEVGGTATDENWTERVQFDHAPVRVTLPVAKERLVTFPNPVALQVPAGAEGLLAAQVIERTAYVRALGPFTELRIVAEDLATGQMVPLDISADPKTRSFSKELEIFYTGTAAPHSGRSAAGNTVDPSESDDQALDMVALTRYAAQAIYAPKRLIPSAPGVQSIPIDPTVLSGLIRGQRVSAVPIGQWRSGSLYVTAVRLTNLESQPVDLDLDQLRGSWIAATPQHRRLLAAGTDWDTTTLYLVCGQSFANCK